MQRVNLFIGTLSSGGAERVVSNLSINLDEDIDKNILMFGENSKIDYPYKGQLFYLDKGKHNNLINKIKLVLLRILNVRKIKDNSPNTTTISFLEYPNLINCLTSNYGRTVVSVRNHMSTKHQKGLKSKFWNVTIKYQYPKADLIISVSEEIKRDLVKNYKIPPNKIKVIYNSYDIDGIRELYNKEIEDEYRDIFQNPVIITAGRLSKQKGHWHLIRAFAKVKEEIPNAKLVILGEGELESYLKELSTELDIIKDIHFLGFQKNPFKYIVRSRIFVLSSFHEGFPNALAEAMACGIPVLSSDCLSGPREILAPNEFGYEKIKYNINLDRYGILTPVCDGNKYGASQPITKEEKKMAECVISILSNANLWDHFSKQSLKRIQDFNINNIIKEWENII